MDRKKHTFAAGRKVHDPSEYREVKTLLAWEAPGRPFQNRGKTYYATGLLIMFLVEVILFLFSQYLLILVVLSVTFVGFALASTPPHTLSYRISTEGVFVEDHFFLWKELYDFYFTEQDGQHVLHIETESWYPGEVLIMLGHVSLDQAKEALLPYLPYREYVKPTFTERAGNWIAKAFPLEEIHKKS